MFNKLSKYFLPIFIGMVIVLYTSVATAVTGSAATFTAAPPTTSPPTPLVMLAMSNDHQLFYKAYTDWDDLDNDGDIETTYDNNFEYSGYFDPQKCYDYVAADQRFEPTAITSDHYCDVVAPNTWSGNFLNWSTMSRVDILRQVFYGGTRSTDTVTETVLERSFLPTDAHSFAKYYGGVDIDRLTPFSVSDITLCNTTYTNDSGTDGHSQNVDEPPLVRVVEGDFRYWAANERWQCTYDSERGNNGSGSNSTGSETHDPNRVTDGLGESVTNDYIARVLVCDSTLIGSEECKLYENAGIKSLKPAGLLQEYGEEGQILFGLMSGSYEKNVSGGVLRKNVSDFSTEVNDDGTFTGVSGIISTLDAIRISRYAYSDNGIYNNVDNCRWGNNSFAEGNCSNWGNPISEMYLEAVRYFSGLPENANFSAPNDSNYIHGLSTEAWVDPLDTSNYCASCNIIVINASEVSYDNDSLDMTGLPGGSGTMARTLTNTVGAAEGITGGQFFVGENGTDNNQQCTAKIITNLGDVRGTCPGSPRLSGTYNIAGIAHWSNTEDIRTDLVKEQQINTYAVALSPAVPNIRVPVPATGNEISILPACWNDSVQGSCAIVDFKILAQDLAAGTGTFYANWEDTEQGGDYDQDMKGVLSYSINSATNEITIFTDVDAKSTPNRMGFGYILSGTTEDGFHIHSGINNFNYTDPIAGILGCANCRTSNAATQQTYTIGASAASLLQDPLFYASKFGGFKDNDNNKFPGTGEWDLLDLDGNANPDGLPDNYFPVTNPAQLRDSLQSVFNVILNKVASGTAAAVTANSVNGTGALYQALYQPVFREADRAISWGGILRGIFIDEKGNLREDSDTQGTKGKLDDCSIDNIFTISYDPAIQKTLLKRFDCDTTTGDPTTLNEAVNQSLLQTIWDARDALDSVSNLTTQRTYNASASSGRYIFSYIDKNSNGIVGNNEMIDFDTSELGSGATDANRFRLMNADSDVEADNIINYIRGEEIAGYRSRTIDYDSDGIDEVWRLGDIVSSTPVVVSVPNKGFDEIYNDDSYRNYKIAHANRREMIYVGANDGMIHAFNSGFFNPTTYEYEIDNGTDTAHPLGSEVWAYVPYSLLPHLRWLTEKDYPHVYYIDGEPESYDIQIFTPDDTYVEGWGTILVVNMRLGGSPISIDHDGDATTADESFRSSIVVLDVTDPESPPKLLAEITHPDLGLTTSKPALMYDKSGTKNNWFLVFGSGPTDLGTVSSNQNAKSFRFNLKNKKFTNTGGVVDLGLPNSFVGDVSTTDWDFDYKSDAYYFGTVESDATTPEEFNGRIIRVRGQNPKTLIDSGQPFVSSPLLIRNQQEHWVFAGSGRLFALSDQANSDQQSFYGIKERLNSSGVVRYNQTMNVSDLQDVTGISVYLDGSTSDATYTTWNDLRQQISTSADGWFKDFDNPDPDPSERNISQAISLFDQYALFTSVRPDVGNCDAAGNSYLNALHIQTGTAYPVDLFGTGSTNSSGVYKALDQIDLGPGIYSKPVLHVGTSGTRIIVQGSGSGGQDDNESSIDNGTQVQFNSAGSRKSWREIQL